MQWIVASNMVSPQVGLLLKLLIRRVRKYARSNRLGEPATKVVYRRP